MNDHFWGKSPLIAAEWWVGVSEHFLGVIYLFDLDSSFNLGPREPSHMFGHNGNGSSLRFDYLVVSWIIGKEFNFILNEFI